MKTEPEKVEYGGRLWPEADGSHPSPAPKGPKTKALAWAIAIVCIPALAAGAIIVGPRVASSTEEASGRAAPSGAPDHVSETSAATLRLERTPFSYKPRPKGCPTWFPAASLEFRGVVVVGTIEGGYSCGDLYADTFFYGFESEAPLIPLPEGTELRIEGDTDLKKLTLEPIGRSPGKQLEIEEDASALSHKPGGYTMEATVAWENSSLTFDFPIRLVVADSPIPLAYVTLPESGSNAALSFEGQQVLAARATAQRSHGEIRVAPLATVGVSLRLPSSAEVWVNADPSDASAAWVVDAGTGDPKVLRVDFGYYDAMGLDLSVLTRGSYQLLIGSRSHGRLVGYSFGIEIQ